MSDRQRPNIVLVLADDLGFSDIGCYGGEIRTPNLDRLAGQGVRMSNFYASPRCSPSRASLLTGRDPHEVGIGVLTADDRPRGYPGSLDPSVPTIAQLLSDAGYATCLSGKWHLASDTTKPNDSWPTRRGFQDFYGILVGAASYYQPKTLHRGEERIDEEAFEPDFFLTDRLTSHAVEFVHRSADAQAPFFLYLAYTAPHWPLHAAGEDVERYRHRFDAGWDSLRDQRLANLEEIGLLPPGTRPSPRDPAEPAWIDVPDADWESRRMEVYAAQVESMDRGVGEVVAALEQTDQLDDTLFIFLSDNGACAEPLPIGPAESFARKTVICPPTTRDGRPVRIGNSPEIVPGAEDTYASYGRAWANLSNTPFRLYKRWVHEGGIASPLVVHWPDGGLATGGIAHQPAQLTDIAPTILAAALAEPLTPPLGRGVSLLSQWREHAAAPPSPVTDNAPAAAGERSLYWEHIGNAALRRGRWKLVREVDGPWELYDLEVDRTELDDLADQRPELVSELAADWQRWAEASGVIPWPEVLDSYRERGRPVAEASG